MQAFGKMQLFKSFHFCFVSKSFFSEHSNHFIFASWARVFFQKTFWCIFHCIYIPPSTTRKTKPPIKWSWFRGATRGFQTSISPKPKRFGVCRYGFSLFLKTNKYSCHLVANDDNLCLTRAIMLWFRWKLEIWKESFWSNLGTDPQNILQHWKSKNEFFKGWAHDTRKTKWDLEIFHWFLF
jgi:hypothetical protein